MGKFVEGTDLEQSDRSADVKGVLGIFVIAVLAALYFASGWVPGI